MKRFARAAIRNPKTPTERRAPTRHLCVEQKYPSMFLKVRGDLVEMQFGLASAVIGLDKDSPCRAFGNDAL